MKNVGKRIFVSLNLAATFEPSINITNLQPHITIDFMLPSQCSLMITQLWSVLLHHMIRVSLTAPLLLVLSPAGEDIAGAW